METDLKQQHDRLPLEEETRIEGRSDIFLSKNQLSQTEGMRHICEALGIFLGNNISFRVSCRCGLCFEYARDQF